MKKYLFATLALIATSFAHQSFPQALPGGGGIVFPNPPQRIHNFLGSGGNKIGYDIFISQKNEMIFFALAAKFPGVIDEAKEMSCLEGFLRGFMQKDKNVLQNAKVINFHGKKALSFSVKNKSRNFLGKTLVFEDFMYLIATEADDKDLQEDQFEKFVRSFTLPNEK